MFLKNFLKKFLKNFEKKIFWKNVKKQGRPSAFFHIFCILHFIWINCKKMQKNKKWHFCHFSHFWKRVQRIHPRVFAVKGGSHPGKNPPIYTVLNAAFSCAKTLCRGSQCTTRARPSGETKCFLPEKFFLLPRILSSQKF